MHTTSSAPAYWTAPFGRPAPVMSPVAPPLRLNFFNFVWGLLIKVAHFYIWAAELPFLIIRSIAPANLKPYVQQAGDLIWSFAGPAINWVYDTSFWAFDTLDYWTDRVTRQAWGVHHANVRHFKVAMEAYLRLLENRADIISKHGFAGIPMAFSAKAA